MPMDVAGLLDGMGVSGPAGLGGCRASGRHLEACAHDVIVFDGGSGCEEAEWEGARVIVWHASLSESRSGRLLGYDGMQVVRDESWELRMLLSRIGGLRARLYADHARRCLVESLVCCQRSRQDPGMTGSCWQKCASCYLADAVCALASRAPGPSHALDDLRGIGGDADAAMGTMGMERASPTLLDRMSVSAAGLAGMAGLPANTMRAKVDHFLENSMQSDCYFYLCRMARDALACIPGAPGRMQELGHVMGTALDAESDSGEVLRRVGLVEGACNRLLGSARQD